MRDDFRFQFQYISRIFYMEIHFKYLDLEIEFQKFRKYISSFTVHFLFKIRTLPTKC